MGQMERKNARDCLKKNSKGERMIALCSKCYYTEDGEAKHEKTKVKLSCKGDVKEAKRNQLAPFQSQRWMETKI